MKHLFVPYEIALKLKELGFDEPCFCAYNNIEELSQLDKLQGYSNALFDYVILAPLYQQVIDWFRIKHYIIITPDVDVIGNTFCHIKSPKNKIGFWSNNQEEPLEYYSALSKAIEKTFKLIE